MKIQDQNLSGASAPETQRTKEVHHTGSGHKAKAAAADATSDSDDTVQLSGTLDSLSRALSTFQTDRASRVQSLAAQYQSGTYTADPHAISRGMITEALG